MCRYFDAVDISPRRTKFLQSKPRVCASGPRTRRRSAARQLGARMRRTTSRCCGRGPNRPGRPNSLWQRIWPGNFFGIVRYRGDSSRIGAAASEACGKFPCALAAGNWPGRRRQTLRHGQGIARPGREPATAPRSWSRYPYRSTWVRPGARASRPLITSRRRAEQTAFGTAPLLPLPACGERVRVRGPLHRLRLAEAPPHPESARRARKFQPLPACGERLNGRPNAIALCAGGGGGRGGRDETFAILETHGHRRAAPLALALPQPHVCASLLSSKRPQPEVRSCGGR